MRGSSKPGSRALGSIVPPTARIRCAGTKAAQIYKKTGNLRAVQLLLGHTKLGSTVRYLGVEVDDALSISEQVEL
jgi:site-specific recombinase XerC